MYAPEGRSKDSARGAIVLLSHSGPYMTGREFIAYTGFDEVAPLSSGHRMASRYKRLSPFAWLPE